MELKAGFSGAPIFTIDQASGKLSVLGIVTSQLPNIQMSEAEKRAYLDYGAKTVIPTVVTPVFHLLKAGALFPLRSEAAIQIRRFLWLDMD